MIKTTLSGLIAVTLFFCSLSQAELLSTGTTTVLSQNNIEITVQADVNLISDTVTLTLSGPASRWWGVGFDANRMLNAYTIVALRNGGNIEERILGCSCSSNQQGVLLNSSLTVMSDTTQGDQRTVVVERPRIHPGSGYDFPDTATTISIIGGYGPFNSDFYTATFMGGNDISELSYSAGQLLFELDADYRGSVLSTDSDQ